MKKYLFLLAIVIIFIGTFNFHIGSTQLYKDLRHSIDVDLPYDTVLENMKSPPLARLLVKLIDVNELNFNQQTLPLISQIQHYYDTTSEADKKTFLKIIKMYIKHGADVNKALSNGNTALFYVKDIPIYELLKAHGININHKNKRGETAYFTVSSNLVRYALIGDGIETDTMNSDGQNLLHKTQSEFSAKALVSKGLNINVKDKYGISPLMALVKENEMRLRDVESFIDLGASFDGIYSGNDDLLSKAVQLNPAVASLLIQRGIKITLKAIERAFQRLYKTKNFYVDSKLLKKLITLYRGKSLDAFRDKRKNTFLHMAMSYESSIAKLLLDKGMNLENENVDGQTPLFLVQSFQMAQLLIHYGAKVNHLDKEGKLVIDRIKDNSIRNFLLESQMKQVPSKGRRYLRSYMDRNHKSLDEKKFRNTQELNVIDYYVEHGERVNVIDRQGRNLLFYANSPDIITYLLDKGVKIEHKDRKNETIIWHYMRLGRADLAERIIDSGIKLEIRNKKNQNLFFAVRNESLIPLLVNIELDINHQDRDKNTALHVINPHVSKKLLEVFFNNDAKLDIKNKKGEISLFNFLDSKRNFDYLVDNGADIYTQDYKGNTLLHKASKLDNLELVDYLLNQDLKANIKNKKKCTALNYAKKGAVYKRLLENGAKLSSSCRK